VTFTVADSTSRVYERLHGNWRPERAGDGDRPGGARCEPYRCARWGNVARGRAGGGEQEKVQTLAAVAAGLGKVAFGGGSVVGDGGGHRRTAEVRGSGVKRAVARARRRWRRREKVGQPNGVGRKKRAPNNCSPERPWFYTQDDL